MKASRKWIFQRISALIIAPLIIWFLISLISLSTGDYNSVINFFSKPLFLFLTTILLITGFFHAKIGLSEIFEDYIHDEKIKNSDLLQKVLDHLDIVKKDLISIFKKNNIEEILAVDKKLDPNLHQAMMEVEDDNKEAGTIVQEIQKGFKMKDRLLRPSLVAVSKKTEKNDEKIEEKTKK